MTTDMPKPRERAIPIGYSHQKNLTVTKNGIEYDAIAFAIKNQSIQCEVRELQMDIRHPIRPQLVNNENIHPTFILSN